MAKKEIPLSIADEYAQAEDKAAKRQDSSSKFIVEGSSKNKKWEIRSFAKYGSIHYQIYFEKQVLELDNKLKSVGIKTKLLRQG